MDRKCIILDGGFASCIDSCYSEEVILCFKIYNNSFYNMKNLKLIICLNDYIEVISVSNNLNDEINKNKIITYIDFIKAHESIKYEISLKNLTFNGISLKVVVTDECGFPLASKKFNC